MSRPSWLFDRTGEWDRLWSFSHPEATGAGLGIVYGRRRQGKTTLLEALVEEAGAHYWQARQLSSQQNLDLFSQQFSRWSGSTDRRRFASWDDAFEATFSLPGPYGQPGVVLIDEFGYLLDAAPEVASVVQAQLTPGALRQGQTRLVLCGSAFSQMKALIGPDAALRGRASLELVVGPFDFRTAAAYWGVDDNPDAAFQLHALVGGTPGYLVLAGTGPRRGAVGRWAVDHLLTPTSPLHREGQVVLSEDPALGSRALYWGLLAAVADGNRRRSDVAAAVGRADASLTFPLRVLAESGWIEQRPDPLHRNRSILLLAEPIVRTHRVLIEPDELRLNRGQAAAVWDDAAHRVASLIYGPHLEWMAAEWLLTHASPETVGGSPRLVGPSTLSAGRVRHQIDLVAVEPDRHGKDQVILIGETKAGASPVGVGELARLDEIAAALGDRASTGLRRLLVGRGGFTAELRRVARQRPDVELADLERLYGGS